MLARYTQKPLKGIAIRSAGFREVSIIEESPFPVESLESDPAVSALIESYGIPFAEIREIADSVVSVGVMGTK